MKLIIADSTDKQYLGHEVNLEDNPIILGGIEFHFDSILFLDNGIRFISSNYIIDTINKGEK